MDAVYGTTAGYSRTTIGTTGATGETGFGRFGAWLAERRRAARTKRELMAYSDRELADMGLTRADIPRVARGQLTR
jgi:uncharacterized protein YjiS (DUF1127 family)